MFVQVIEGPVSDPQQAKTLLDRWVTELGPTADGWLGSTAGVTDDGTFVALARFESEEAARRNSDRPEQGEWWAQMAEVFTSEPEFHDSTEVDVDDHGDLDSAGFVQVMQGRTSDPQRARELMNDDNPEWQTYRPDVLGSLSAVHDGDAWTMAIYFSSEDEARAGEQKEPPESIRKAMAEVDSLTVGDTSYFDLKDPWLVSPS
ncbi:hypothetical protein [Nocardioides astragali]|uniref:ABM domain-containing protein n=1 Tax=Nocardioides astragali TaxID=1776736 RepID=A0ABW2N1R8_9ACTN|nr:hypothetical protein [Nocardioides astragali]